jgi:two-component system, OmpR family, response regulator
MTPTLTPAAQHDRAAPDPAPPRLLVVDDEPAIRELLFLALRFEGWAVRTAEDGAGAVRTAREFSPDVVLLDVMLPDMDGFEVLRRLRAEAPRLPVVFVTARDAPADRAAGLAAGGDDYVTKPFGLDDVVTRLRRLLPAG